MGLIGPTFFQDNPKEIRLLEHPYQCKFFLLFCTKKKNILFLFYTSIFTKHPHQSIYSTHLFNKILILLTFFVIFFSYFLHCLSLPLRPNHHQHHYLIGEPFKIKPTQDQKPIQAETHSFWNPNHHPPTHLTFRHTIVLGCEDVMARSLKDWDLRTRIESRTKEEANPLALMFCFSNYHHSLSPIWCRSSEFFVW